MNWNAFRRPRRKGALAIVAVAALLATAACGSDDDSASGGGGIPSKVKVVGIEPLDRPGGLRRPFRATRATSWPSSRSTIRSSSGPARRSTQLEGHQGRHRHGRQRDDPGHRRTEDVAAIFGSVSSQEAVAQSPLARRPDADHLHPGRQRRRRHRRLHLPRDAADELATTRSSRSTSRTTANVHRHHLHRRLADPRGDRQEDTSGASLRRPAWRSPSRSRPPRPRRTSRRPSSRCSTPTRTSSSILQIGAANPTAMTQLRQAGYDRPVLGNSGASAGNLKPAGRRGAGMAWPVDFDPSQEAPEPASSSRTTTRRVRRAAAQLRGRGLRRGVVPGSLDQGARVTRAATASRTAWRPRPARPSDGALGSDLVWKDGTIEVAGVVVEWDGTGSQLLYADWQD